MVYVFNEINEIMEKCREHTLNMGSFGKCFKANSR